MKVCLFLNQLTPHLLPLAKEFCKQCGVGNVRYYYTTPLESSRMRLGWSEQQEQWTIQTTGRDLDFLAWVDSADIFITEKRDVEVWKRRIAIGKRVFYTSERWFKPLPVKVGRIEILMPGELRFLKPRFLKLSWEISRLYQTGLVTYLADGIYAVRDFGFMLRIFGLCRGSSLKLDQIRYENKPFGTTSVCENIRMWGYFVERSCCERQCLDDNSVKKVLWVGRLLRLKCVDTIVKAVGGLPNFTLTICGVGPDERRLKRMSALFRNVDFMPPLAYDKVRRLMRENDIYIFASNALEGWGAVVNEALEEGMFVLGSNQAGASRTLLPADNRFDCRNWHDLRRKCLSGVNPQGIGLWNVGEAVRVLINRERKP